MSHSSASHAHELTQAFDQFNRVSEDLSASYQQLEERIGLLTRRLASSSHYRPAGADKVPVNHFHETVLDVLPGGVVVLDGDGRIQLCNGLALEYLGSPLLGELWREVAARAFMESSSHDALRLRDGRLVDISTCPLGRMPGQVLLFRDVTASCAMQALMSRHQRLVTMGEMVASLAHQIRTPIASSLLYLSHLRSARMDEAARGRCLEKIRSCLAHLEGMVGDMLQFARGGRMGDEIISVSALVNDLDLLLRPQLGAHDCEFVIRDDSGGKCVYGSRDALLSVMQNLVVNALQAIAEARGKEAGGPGRLELRAATRDGKTGRETVCLVLRDNGPGIPPEIQAHVFEPFYTTKSQGTGLGLAVVKAIVAAHNGAVWLDSKPGGGTTIGIELPVHHEA